MGGISWLQWRKEAAATAAALSLHAGSSSGVKSHRSAASNAPEQSHCLGQQLLSLWYQAWWS
jgi:hypothetical protein